MPQPPIPMCYKCRHYAAFEACVAYPNGIPAEIFRSEHDHRQPYPGDHGIRFEPLEATNAD